MLPQFVNYCGNSVQSQQCIFVCALLHIVLVYSVLVVSISELVIENSKDFLQFDGIIVRCVR